MEAKNIIPALLRWYARHKRDLPWRHNVTPYRVWLSEIMLQQTTVPAVIPYFLKFTEKYPDVAALAAAPVEDIMHDWAGLGYYSRARNLHACAKAVTATGGAFPADEDALRALPGIGPYTAAAIAAIAFRQKAAVVDGNVDRVIARLYALETPLPALKPEIREKAAALYLHPANTDPAALPQAFMDLGATICTPQSPKCGVCPLTGTCLGKAAGIAADLPRRAPKAPRPKRAGWVYWIENGKGEILIERRPDKGLLGGMTGLPTGEWTEGKNPPAHRTDLKNIEETDATIRHVFTHFELTLHVARASASKSLKDAIWRAPEDAGLPSVFKKVVKRRGG